MAVRAAAARNESHVVRGTARFAEGSLEDADPVGLGEFDAVFAIDVNLFWTRAIGGRSVLGVCGRPH